MMPILVDGHNLIGRLGTPSLQDPDDEEILIRLLKSYQARTGKAITIVFDPGGAFALPQSRQEGGVEVVFAPHGGSADAVIVRRVRRSRNPSGLVVVTSDRELADMVTRRGARVRSAEEFAAELGRRREVPADGKDEMLSPGEVEAWLALFEGRDGGDVLDKMG